MNLGLFENTKISTKNTPITVSNLNNGHQIKCLLDSEDFVYENILDKTSKKTTRCLEILFSDQTKLQCGEFVCVFSLDRKGFVAVHRLVVGEKIRTSSGYIQVKSMKILFDLELILLKFDKKISFFANDILCHTLEEPSDYDVFYHKNNNVTPNDILSLSQLIYPEHDYNLSLFVHWKYNIKDTWRKAYYLLDCDYEQNSTGYKFSNTNSLMIKITYNMPDTFLFFKAHGSDFKISANQEKIGNIDKYVIGNDCFMVLAIKNDLLSDEVFCFYSQGNTILQNCMLLTKQEEESIRDYFQGFLVENE